VGTKFAATSAQKSVIRCRAIQYEAGATNLVGEGFFREARQSRMFFLQLDGGGCASELVARIK
jgi:hypothetical protein